MMGGPERTFTFTRGELSEQIEKAYWQGFEFAYERARDELRNEVRDELQDELADPDCPMCLLRREANELVGQVAELEREITALRDRVAKLNVAYHKEDRR